MENREQVRIREAKFFGLSPYKLMGRYCGKAMANGGLSNKTLWWLNIRAIIVLLATYIVGVFVPALNSLTAILIGIVMSNAIIPNGNNFWVNLLTILAALIFTLSIAIIAYLVPFVGALLPTLSMFVILFFNFIRTLHAGRTRYFGEQGLPEVRALNRRNYRDSW